MTPNRIRTARASAAAILAGPMDPPAVVPLSTHTSVAIELSGRRAAPGGVPSPMFAHVEHDLLGVSRMVPESKLPPLVVGYKVVLRMPRLTSGDIVWRYHGFRMPDGWLAAWNAPGTWTQHGIAAPGKVAGQIAALVAEATTAIAEADAASMVEEEQLRAAGLPRCSDETGEY